MTVKKIYSTLHINNLELNVNLGWRTQERKKDQGIVIDLIIRFPTPPKACNSDLLEDTFCYATLIEKIRAHLNQKHYKLIEHLCADIYGLVKANLPKKIKLNISLTKYPKIEGLSAGVSFCYGDEK
jgi:FolB domain-containing protein